MSPTLSDPLVLAYRTPNSVEARALAAELEDADIAVQIVGDFRDVAYPGLGISGMADKELWVAGAQAARCAEIVSEWRRRHHPGEEQIAASKFQFSTRTALVLMTATAIACFVFFERGGERQVENLVAIQVLVMSAFFVVAWRRVLRRSASGNDDGCKTEDQRPQS
jgi:hypothetical protein